KLIAQLKLYPTPEQADALKRTLEVSNATCNYISNLAWEHAYLASLRFRSCAIRTYARRSACRRKWLCARLRKLVTPTNWTSKPSAHFVRSPRLLTMTESSRSPCPTRRSRSGHWTGGRLSHSCVASVNDGCSKLDRAKAICCSIAVTGICWWHARLK